MNTFSLHRDKVTEQGKPPAGRASDGVWRELSKASFAIVSHVTPAGKPRSSGIMYLAVARHLYVVISPDSWKAVRSPTAIRSPSPSRCAEAGCSR